MSEAKVIELIKRGAISLLYVSGTALAAFNVTAFKGDRYGLYFKDANQQWLAVGLALLAAGWLVRNWKKL